MCLESSLTSRNYIVLLIAYSMQNSPLHAINDIKYVPSKRDFQFCYDIVWNDKFYSETIIAIISDYVGHMVRDITRCIWCLFDLIDEMQTLLKGV